MFLNALFKALPTDFFLI